jgi:hypothetical protein
MVTFRQVARSYVAAARRAEREQKRRANEAARDYKEQLKQEEILNVADAVRQYEAYITVLMSVHKSCADKLDWQQVLSEEEPEKPERESTLENEARLQLEKFKPSFLDKIFGTEKGKIKKLEAQILVAKQKDEENFEERLKEYHQQYDEWNVVQTLGVGIEQKSPEAYRATLEFFEPFSDIGAIGSSLDFNFSKDHVDIELHVNSADVIPDFVVSQTSGGKLSRKSMPKSKFNELYQDYVCGSVLRVAREILAYLPVSSVAVHALAEVLNTKTGQLEETPILSALFVPATMDKLNFQSLDPSDAMANFVHHMKFSKTNGFSPVGKVE